MKYKKIYGFALLLCLGITALAQETPDGYNPFVPANLDDPAKLPETPVVESSYHRYSVAGDVNYVEASVFVWYVENGTFGTYDQVTDTWTPAAGANPLGSGSVIELSGDAVNASEIWVRWNDGSGGSYGYIAVYERSYDNCILTDQITGYKHLIRVPPEIWFLVGERQECADQEYAVTVQFNELHSDSYPYVFICTYPNMDGSFEYRTDTIAETDLDASLQYTFNLPGVEELDAAVDEEYVIAIDVLRDSFGSVGKIAPRGPIDGQFPDIAITILHLPQTGDMTMD